MKYLILVAFIWCVGDSVKQDTIPNATTSALSREFKYIQTRERTIKEIDTLSMKFDKILELLNDSTKKK